MRKPTNENPAFAVHDLNDQPDWNDPTIYPVHSLAEYIGDPAIRRALSLLEHSDNTPEEVVAIIDFLNSVWGVQEPREGRYDILHFDAPIQDGIADIRIKIFRDMGDTLSFAVHFS